MPSLVGSKPVGSDADLGGHDGLELVVGHFKERQ